VTECENQRLHALLRTVKYGLFWIFQRILNQRLKMVKVTKQLEIT